MFIHQKIQIQYTTSAKYVHYMCLVVAFPWYCPRM